VAVLTALAGRYGLKLLHISTDYVFDGMADRPYKETDPVNPQSVYGQTKLEGELIIRQAGIDAAIIRTSWLYSEFGHNFVKTMLRLAETKDSISVVTDQRGSPTYAGDLAAAIMAVAVGGVAGTEVYHYSNSGEITWHDFASEIFRFAGKSVRVDPISASDYPAAARRPAYSVLDTAKIRGLGVNIPRWRESRKVCIERITGNI
jgi:dTDP-4-dehydrorhamnose reductase